MNDIQKLRELANRRVSPGNFDESNLVTTTTMSFKGNTSISNGYVYAPYIPLQFFDLTKKSTTWDNPVV